MRTIRISLPRLSVVAGFALVAAGCAGASGLGATGSTLVFLVILLVGGVVACIEPAGEADGSGDTDWTVPNDADTQEPTDASPDVPPDTRGEGRWVTCCEDGEISSCYCPANVACNYGRFVRCGGNKCTYDRNGCDPDAGDAGDTVDVPDVSDATDSTDGAEGTWERCCRDGRVDTCYCPAGAVCNYGWFTDCGNGYCIPRGQDTAACPEVGDGGDGPYLDTN